MGPPNSHPNCAARNCACPYSSLAVMSGVSLKWGFPAANASPTSAHSLCFRGSAPGTNIRTLQTRVSPSEPVTSSNRWVIPIAAVAIHICIGSVYAWSTFNRPIHALFPNDPWWFSPPYITFSSAIILLGLSAAFGGQWVERKGPRVAAAAAAVFFGSGLVIGGIGLAVKQSVLVLLGIRVIAGIGCALRY